MSTGDLAPAARAYVKVQPRFARGLQAIDSIFEGFWLGVLDRDGLADVDRSFYDSKRESVGEDRLLYTDDAYNDQGLFGWEAAIVDEYFPPRGRVVVSGAGGGREVLGLRLRGFDAVGYEPHAGFARAGADYLARRGHPGVFRHSARDVFPHEDGCDAVVVGWGSYMLIPGRRRRVEFLRAARNQMPPGAPLLTSFFTRSAGYRHAYRVAASANLVRRVMRREPVDVGDLLFPQYVHRFLREEIEQELADGGFRMAHWASEPYGHAVGIAE